MASAGPRRSSRLAAAGTSDQIVGAIAAWRSTLSALLRAALDERRPGHGVDTDALADHVFVTFEGAFLLCRSTGDDGHMRAQLSVLRRLFESLLA